MAKIKYKIINLMLRRLSLLIFGSDITQYFQEQSQLGLLKLFGSMLRHLPRKCEVGWLLANRDERMDANVPIFNEERRRFHLERYAFTKEYIKGNIVADIACGTGYGTSMLAKRDAVERVIGVDIDLQAINYATKMYGSHKVSFCAASADSTGLPDGFFDTVVSFETIEHVNDDRALLREFSRILKPEGLLICSTPNNWPLECAKYHVRTYDLKAFEEVLSEQFSIIGMFNQNSGCDHPFNHGQHFGIVNTNSINKANAECFIAVCKKTA
jgi:2-polyprenyl-3-methyl-5-hydroxy-6-metoxy-1,4-benzoquinol methylase